MKISIKQILIVISLTQYWFGNVSNAQTPILDKLFDESEIIVQGQIKEIHCFHNGLGHASLDYAIQVDSIYKGTPDIYDMEAGEFLQPEQTMTINEMEKKLRITYFRKNCISHLRTWSHITEEFQDNCYKVGENMIVFLKDHEMNVPEIKKRDKNTRFPYNMTDQWLGALPANSYVSEYLRQKVRE